MEAATALAPALGVDAAALVGRALHEGRVGDAAAASGVAAGARVAGVPPPLRAPLAGNFGRTRSESEREAQRLRRVIGMEIMGAFTDEVLVADTDDVLLRRAD